MPVTADCYYSFSRLFPLRVYYHYRSYTLRFFFFFYYFKRLHGQYDFKACHSSNGRSGRKIRNVTLYFWRVITYLLLFFFSPPIVEFSPLRSVFHCRFTIRVNSSGKNQTRPTTFGLNSVRAAAYRDYRNTILWRWQTIGKSITSNRSENPHCVTR